MRLTIPQPELAAATQWIARQLPNQPLQPQLMGLRLEAVTGRLTLAAFDGVTATRARLDADVDTDGTVFVSARLLADVLATLGKSDVTLVAGERGLAVTAIGAAFELPVLDDDGYPALPAMPPVTGSVNAADLAAAYKKVKAGVDPKAVGHLGGMAGVRMRADGSHLQLTTTDRYRVPTAWLPWTSTAVEDGAAAVLPEKLLAANLPAFDGTVQVALSQRAAGFSDGTRELITSVLDFDTFPARVDSIVPTEFTGAAYFDADDMAGALRRVAVVTHEGMPVWMRIVDGVATLRAADHGTAHATLDTEWDGDGDEFEAAWNPGYLGDGLAPLTGRIRMRVTTPHRPAVIDDPNDDTYRYVVIPIREPEKAA